MKKRILLIGGNYFPEPTGIGKYNGEMIRWLSQEGHECTVITTFPYYPHWKVQPPYRNRSYWFKSETVCKKDGRPVKIIRCPHYVPKKPSGLTRIVSEFSFFVSAYIVVLLLLFKRKFDFVITVAPPFEIGLLGIIYSKIRGTNFLYHIQDLQVDAARDLVMIRSNLIINTFLAIERFIIKNADFVSTISTGMVEKVKNKWEREVVHFPNWVDVEAFHPIEEKSEIKTKFGFNSDDKIVLYAGAIGQKQGLEAILKSAKILRDVPNIKFAICGSGPYKEQLVALRDKMNLKNVVFLPLQHSNEFNNFLNMADLHLVLQKSGASDLVLPSKLSTILSVGGVAIVTANKGTSLYNIMSSTNMGILIKPENVSELVSAITSTTQAEIEEKGKKARLYAKQNLSDNQVLTRYFNYVFTNKKAKVKTSFSKVIANGLEGIV